MLVTAITGVGSVTCYKKETDWQQKLNYVKAFNFNCFADDFSVEKLDLNSSERKILQINSSHDHLRLSFDSTFKITRWYKTIARTFIITITITGQCL